MGTCWNLYHKFFGIFSYLQSPFIFILRLYWGYLFMLQGYNKFNMLDSVATSFEGLGIMYPYLAAWLVAFVECIGGLCLILGFLSHFWAFALTIVMIVAYITAHSAGLVTLYNEGPDILLLAEKFITEPPFNYMLMTMLVLFYGPGSWSLDRILCKGKWN